MKKFFLIVLVFTVIIVFASSTFAKEEYVKYDLRSLSKKSENRLKSIDQKLAEAKLKKEAEKKLAELDSLYQQAENLYSQGKYEEAKPIYAKIKKFTKDPDIKSRATEKRKELEAQRVQKEKEEKERVRIEKERQKNLEREKKDARRKEKEKHLKMQRDKKAEEQKKLKAQKDEQQKVINEQKRKERELDKQQRLAAKAEREKDRALEKEKKAALEKEKKKARELEKQKKAREKKERDLARKQMLQEQKLEQETIKESLKISKKMEIFDEPGTKIENLTYGTEKDCLNVIDKNPSDKNAYNNLVDLYVARDQYLAKAEAYYKNNDYQKAREEYNRALFIEPGNKKATAGLKQLQLK